MSSASFDFTGAVAIVTGGTKGIGRTICERFLAAGAEVVTCGRSEPESLPSAGGRTARFVATDVRDPEQVDALVTATEEWFGGLHVVVNNAGGSPHSPADEASPRFSESIIRLNLLAPLHLAQRANRTMQAQDEGGVALAGEAAEHRDGCLHGAHSTSARAGSSLMTCATPVVLTQDAR